MGDLWIAGADRRQVHSGGRMVGGPPRVTHHITYDSLAADGSPAIGFSEVANYLNNVGYQVHLVWDPVTGNIIQLLPANVGGAGLRHTGSPETNNMGEVNIQIEAYFTPGETRFGVHYDQLTDTPMTRLADILAFADGWGIPRVAPLSPGNRNANVWVNVAGHYGHFNVPENDHSDPVVSIQSILDHGGQPAPPPPPKPKENELMILRVEPDGKIFLVIGSRKPVYIDDPKVVDQLRGQGVPYVNTDGRLYDALNV